MKICYLLASTELCGGVRVVFDQARALQARGHHVVIRAAGGDHSWYHQPMVVDYVTDLGQEFADRERPDIVVATFWTTVKAAGRLKTKALFHFCQGHEADFPEYSSIKEDIKAVYRMPIPKLTVGTWLVQRLHDCYGSNSFACHCVGQIVDLDLFRPVFSLRSSLRRWLGLPVRILLVGQYSASVKGIREALQAVALLRKDGCCVELIRVSAEPLSAEESAITAVNCHYRLLRPVQMSRLYHSADLLLAPSHPEEGFGLPFAEALASGLPCVATAIPSHSSFAPQQDYAVFVSSGEPLTMARATADLLRNKAQLSLLRRRGPQVVRQFRADEVALRLESLFEQALAS